MNEDVSVFHIINRRVIYRVASLLAAAEQLSLGLVRTYFYAVSEVLTSYSRTIFCAPQKCGGSPAATGVQSKSPNVTFVDIVASIAAADRFMTRNVWDRQTSHTTILS